MKQGERTERSLRGVMLCALRRTAMFLAKKSIELLLRSCSIRVTGADEFVEAAATAPVMLVLWHECLLIMPALLQRKPLSNLCYSAFVSDSRDGQQLAQLITSYPNGRVVRVPHNKRMEALHRLVTTIQERESVAVITPDGPRGPPRLAKGGVALAAQKTNAQIVTVRWQASRSWHLPTWDQMRIPRPFSRIELQFGRPEHLPEGLSRAEATQQIEALLNTAAGSYAPLNK